MSSEDESKFLVNETTSSEDAPKPARKRAAKKTVTKKAAKKGAKKVAKKTTTRAIAAPAQSDMFMAASAAKAPASPSATQSQPREPDEFVPSEVPNGSASKPGVV
ncbi:MAG: hypothetical protein P8M62_05395, partial [Opitutae bacterium]|nr:hypothetical protein [Opitutae bacterium]